MAESVRSGVRVVTPSSRAGRLSSTGDPPLPALWGKPIDEAMRDNPHLEFKRLPSYSPQLNPIERFWKKLRRRVTHNRLFDTLGDLKTSLRASLSYFQTARHKVKSIIHGRPKRKATK